MEKSSFFENLGDIWAKGFLAWYMSSPLAVIISPDAILDYFEDGNVGFLTQLICWGVTITLGVKNPDLLHNIPFLVSLGTTRFITPFILGAINYEMDKVEFEEGTRISDRDIQDLANRKSAYVKKSLSYEKKMNSSCMSNDKRIEKLKAAKEFLETQKQTLKDTSMDKEKTI